MIRRAIAEAMTQIGAGVATRVPMLLMKILAIPKTAANAWKKRRREAIKKRRRSPIRWLTYKKRLQDDVESAFSLEGGPEFFSQRYIDNLVVAVRMLDAWSLKIMGLQLAITLFLLLGVASTDNSISLFGVSLKSVVGAKEILVSLSASLTLITLAVTHTRDVRFIIIEKVTRLTARPDFLELALIATPSAYFFRLYLARQFARWQFSTLFSKVIRTTFGVLAAAMVLTLLFVFFGLQIFFVREIWEHPTLPVSWSRSVVIYVVCGYALGLLGIVVQHLPLPYRDSGSIKELAELERSDPEAYQRRLQELYGD
jgi:hypothetical protein